jgi:hypothetical protein
MKNFSFKEVKQNSSLGSSINDVTQIWTFFYTPIVTFFISEALVLLSQNPLPPPPKTVTSFMDAPVGEWGIWRN